MAPAQQGPAQSTALQKSANEALKRFKQLANQHQPPQAAAGMAFPGAGMPPGQGFGGFPSAGPGGPGGPGAGPGFMQFSTAPDAFQRGRGEPPDDRRQPQQPPQPPQPSQQHMQMRGMQPPPPGQQRQGPPMDQFQRPPGAGPPGKGGHMPGPQGRDAYGDATQGMPGGPRMGQMPMPPFANQ